MSKKSKTAPKPEGYTFGRPTTYRPEYCQMLIDHMAEGYSFESFAGVLKTTSQTLYAWLDKNQDFLDARNIGLEQSRMFWEKQGRDGLWSSRDGAQLNARLWEFNMKNRFKWRDRQADEVPLVIQTQTQQLAQSNMNREDLVKLAKEAIDIEVKRIGTKE